MTTAGLLSRGWIRAQAYTPAIVAAALMYGGIHQILSALQYPLSDYAVRLINRILRQAFRDVMPLPEFGAIPWLYHAKIAAVGVIVVAVGMLIGLWAQARSQNRPTT